MGKRQKTYFEFGNAICYSGFRESQEPGGIIPDYEQIKEDLMILRYHWKYLRLYDCDEHALRVLDVITREKLDFKVMMGAYLLAELNNFGCPWGGVYPEEVLKNNKRRNINRIKKLITLASQYPNIIFALSAGNENCVDWSGQYVPVSSVIKYVRMLKESAKQPVTFCDNYVPWLSKLKNLAEEVDFISIHTYPVWEYKNIHESLDYTVQNYQSVAGTYPGKPIVITEAGWATHSNGRGILPSNVSEENQDVYVRKLLSWSKKEKILVFVFEAFDEPWKGSPEPLEPEKHWGLYKVDRTPKLVMMRHH